MLLPVIITFLFTFFFSSECNPHQLDTLSGVRHEKHAANSLQSKNKSLSIPCEGDGCKWRMRRSAEVAPADGRVTHHHGKVTARSQRNLCDKKSAENASNGPQKSTKKSSKPNLVTKKGTATENTRGGNEGYNNHLSINSPPAKVEIVKPKIKPIVPTPPKAKTKAGNSSDTQFIQKWLDAHNAVRSLYKVGNLVWSEELAASALDWSSKCKWDHSYSQYGQNLAAGQETPEDIMEQWVYGDDECSVYNPASPIYSHFTQVVWASTKKVGCGMVKCENIAGLSLRNAPMWTCEYDPAGNVEGEYATNVLAGRGDCRRPGGKA